ncbi:IclR family transcriptional regulator [Paracoccus onubensis]|uniref:IclR family transcriptional regulator n=2 Tax=Paracoccus onubensis TaxID=1675788 RepID=A0A418SXZ3_9RHOB|nr:IclR family transcriptional regulator [Paracoccus onubensis]
MPNNQPDSPTPPESIGMRAVDRIAAILRSFSMTRPMLSLTEVAMIAGLDKNTTRRLLLALCAAGLVRRDEADGRFGLDIGILKLQPAVLGPRALRETAAPYLQWLTEQSGMTSFFWIADPDGAICIERVRASGVFLDVPWSTPGTVVPLNMAAGPRVVLAHLDDTARAAWLARTQHRFTRFTQTDPTDLLRAVARIRAEGHELILNDYYVGMGGLGVPVLDRSGAFVGAISVTSGTGEFQDPGRMQRVLAAAQETASAIGIRLGPHACPVSGQAE